MNPWKTEPTERNDYLQRVKSVYFGISHVTIIYWRFGLLSSQIVQCKNVWPFCPLVKLLKASIPVTNRRVYFQLIQLTFSFNATICVCDFDAQWSKGPGIPWHRAFPAIFGDLAS